jgi:hypothetical protein
MSHETITRARARARRRRVGRRTEPAPRRGRAHPVPPTCPTVTRGVIPGMVPERVTIQLPLTMQTLAHFLRKSVT